MKYVFVESEYLDELFSFRDYPSIVEDDRAGPVVQPQPM